MLLDRKTIAVKRYVVKLSDEERERLNTLTLCKINDGGTRPGGEQTRHLALVHRGANIEGAL